MIPTEIIKKIKRMHIKSSRTVNSIMAGQYKSVFKGAGIEFEEVREYSPGDDVKTIDWKVSARLGRPFVKLYTEERESIVLLLIDMSASLYFGSRSVTKLERCAEAAAVLAFSAIKNNDKVGVIFFTDRVEHYIPPEKGTGHIWRVIKEIFTFAPRGRQTDISQALDYLGKIMKKRAFVFILSDFMDTAYLKSLKNLRQKHEVIGVMIHDEGEARLPDKGIINMVDFETGTRFFFDAFSKGIRTAFTDARKQERNRTLDLFLKARSDMIELSTTASVSDTLSRYFRQRERRIR